MKFARYFTAPLVNENPVMVQILGLCSALAVSRTLEPAIIMAVRRSTRKPISMRNPSLTSQV